MKNLYICSCILLLLVFFGSCTKDITQPAIDGDHQIGLSIVEAKSFFESQFAKAASSHDGKELKTIGLLPGEFTPCWNQAKTSQNNKEASVDIPIISKYCYRVIRCESTGKKVSAYRVEIDQRLVITKNLSNNRFGLCIMSVIPDLEYYQTNRGQLSDKILSLGSKGNFSGIIIFSNPYTGVALGLTKYYNGRCLEGVRITYTESDEAKIRLERAMQILGTVKIIRGTSNSLTRSWGEDDNDVCSSCGSWGCGGSCDYYYCGYCGGIGCAGCNGIGEDSYNCLQCYDQGCDACDYGGGVDFPDDDLDYDIGFGWEATCPNCKRYTWKWGADDGIPNSARCPVCGIIVRFTW